MKSIDPLEHRYASITSWAIAAAIILLATSGAQAQGTIRVFGGYDHGLEGLKSEVASDVYRENIVVNPVKLIQRTQALEVMSTINTQSTSLADSKGILKVRSFIDWDAEPVTGTKYTEYATSFASAGFTETMLLKRPIQVTGASGIFRISYYVPYDLEVPTSVGTTGSASTSGGHSYYDSQYTTSVSLAIASSYIANGQTYSGANKRFLGQLGVGNNIDYIPYSTFAANNKITVDIPFYWGESFSYSVDLSADAFAIRNMAQNGIAPPQLNVPGATLFADAGKSLYFDGATILDYYQNDIGLDTSIITSGLGIDYTKSLAPVPEPSQLALVIAGLLLVGGVAVRRQDSSI